MRDDLRNCLQAYWIRTFPDKQDAKIGELVRFDQGLENELYFFNVKYGTAEAPCEELVLRIYPGDGADSKSAHEFHSMKRLHEIGYPVPQVLILGRENSPLGKPFIVMKRVAGEAMGSLLFSVSETKQQALVTLFCELLAQLHMLDWRPFAGDYAGVEQFRANERYQAGDRYAFVDQWLRRALGLLRHFPETNLAPAVAWLERQRDELPCLCPSVVHCDYHPNNVLLCDDGSAVVVDWTNFDISDPRFDLACTLTWFNAYLGTAWRDLILQKYEYLTGVKMEQIELFEVSAYIESLFRIAISLLYGPGRIGMRPDAVAMMKEEAVIYRRICVLLREATGIRIAKIERLLASLTRYAQSYA